jgi:hypothetical protein
MLALVIPFDGKAFFV